MCFSLVVDDYVIKRLRCTNSFDVTWWKACVHDFISNVTWSECLIQTVVDFYYFMTFATKLSS